MLIREFLRVWYRVHEETRRRQKGQHKFAFSTVDWKHELQSVWLQGRVTGSTRISIQIWHWHSDKEGMASLDTAIFNVLMRPIQHQHLEEESYFRPTTEKAN
jgi:hypothetical protein